MTEQVKECVEQAERFLVLREHNKNELIDKLKAKNYEQTVIDEAITFLVDCDELNESRYIKTYVRSSNKKHPEGKRAVLTRLMSKRADRELSKMIVDSLYTPEYTKELISNALKKIEKKGKATDKYQIKQELIKLGFSASEINLFFEERENVL